MPATTAPRSDIGYLTNYSFHIWYQIVIEILRRRAKQYGAEVVIQDAGKSVEQPDHQAREMISKVDALLLTPAGTSPVWNRFWNWRRRPANQ